MDIRNLRTLVDLDDDPDTLAAYSVDFGRVVKRTPLAVVHPTSSRQVAEVVREAARAGCAVSVQGARHSQGGQSLSDGGILLDMKGLNHIGEVEGQTVEAGAGASWWDLTQHVFARTYMPPALTSHLAVTIGGTLAIGGLSGSSHLYGTQTDCVQELEVVTGEGRLVRCSRDRNRALFDCTRCGLGQFSVITRARLQLRKAHRFTKTYSLAYGDVETFMEDQAWAATVDRFAHIGAWCAPAFSDLWQFLSGKLFQNRRYSLHLAVAYDDDEPVQDAILDGMPSAKPVLEHDSTTLAFANRWATISETDPWFDDWSLAHPVVNGLLPWEAGAPYMDQVLSDLPTSLARQARVMLGVARRDRFSSPLFMRPDSDLMLGFGLLIELPPEQLPEALPTVERARDHFSKLGGKHYPSGLLGFSHEQWKLHYGELWPKVVEWKRTFDPAGILNPGTIRYESE